MSEVAEAVVVPMRDDAAKKSKKVAAKKASTKKAAVKKAAGPRKRVSRAERFLKDEGLRAEFVKRYPVCTGDFRRTPGTPPTKSHSIQAKVNLPDGKQEWVYKQDVFQVGRHKPKAAKKAAKPTKKTAKKAKKAANAED